MGDRHGWWFKFPCGAYSLLRVGGYTTRVHQAVVGGDGLPSVADVHPCTFASGVAGSFAGPGHTGLFAALLGRVDVVPLDHVADILVRPFIGIISSCPFLSSFLKPINGMME